jgi:hypothetical protein
MVGLGNVDDTSDANKPVSSATQTALDLKAPLASPTFTGTVTTSGLLTASNGFTVSSGTITLPSASIADSALSANIVTLAGSQTLVNKTFTSPVISTISNSGTITVPTGTHTLATLDGTETLTNKTITTSGLLSAGAGISITSGDLSCNNNVSIGANTTIAGKMAAQGAFLFGSSPVTKYYSWSGTPSASTITSPKVTLTYGNNSFYAKLHCFLSDTSNPSNMSSQIIEVQGGSTDGSTPTLNIVSISRTTTANSYFWNTPTFDKNSVYLGSESLAGVSAHYSIRVELIQTNNSASHQPTMQSITMVNDNAGGTTTTTYNY